MKNKFIKKILYWLLVITISLFISDNAIDLYNISENGQIVFDVEKTQEYIRGLAISLLILAITVFVIEYYFRNKLEEIKNEEEKHHLNKAVELLLLVFKNYQKSLYFLLYSKDRKDEYNLPVDFPFKYLENIFDMNFNLSNSFGTKSRIEEYINAYNDFKKELWSIYLNNNLKPNTELFISLKKLIHEMEENENFKSLIDYPAKQVLNNSSKDMISNIQDIPEIKPSNIINPFVFLYRSINSILKFKEELKNIYENQGSQKHSSKF